MILQNFELIKDETYKLKYQVTMTVRPIGLFMKVRLRNGRRATDVIKRGQPVRFPPAATKKAQLWQATPDGDETNASLSHQGSRGSTITILFASNSGSCEALAHRLAVAVAERGIQTRTIDRLDNAVGILPKDVPVIIVTASYNGEPADDAEDFVHWIKCESEGVLDGVKFGVFGCGK